MKKFISIILIMCMVLGSVPCSFGATETFNEALISANTLNGLGLFSGTGTNPDGTPIYALEQTPNRHQAVTMLVKLLGKEQEALNGTWTTPFTDVANWAKPYVGYAYNNGLTSGTSATTYGGNNPVTATQYLTFVLSALGYTSGVDFKWNEAWKLSDQIGLTDGRYNTSTNKNFLRGDIAIISANALEQKVKGTSTLMLNQIQANLNASGAGTTQGSAKTDAAFKEYQRPVQKRPNPLAVGSVQPYSEYWFKPSIPEDLSDALELAYTLTVSDVANFSKGKPAGYDLEALIEWGKDPGLNVYVLHEMGYTGKGAVIAYIDQPAGAHEQYNSVNLHYTNNAIKDKRYSNSDDAKSSMHGPAVLSLLAGKDIGTAPEAEIYFYGHASWAADQTTHAECLYQIIEQNKKLPNEKKITMVGFSDNVDDNEKNADAFRKAVAACEATGVKVFFCADYDAASFIPMSDKNDPDNLINSWGAVETVAIPTGGRTTAATNNGAKYYYWSEGGLSWGMPYVLGLYAIAGEIDPSLTADQLRQTLYDTAITNANGIRVVDPVGFVAKVLKGAGKTAAAQSLLNKAETNTRYLYYVMNSKQMTSQDMAAVNAYLNTVNTAKIITVDSSYFASATELYDALKKDHEKRGGTVVGVQLLGEPSATPAFEVGYVVQMANDIDDAGSMLTDFFYSNFENDSKLLRRDYSIYKQFKDNLDVDLIAQWPVARLPLKKGEFAAFYEKYDDFKSQVGNQQLDIVNFSNPIFAQKNHTDDMGIFLNRAKNEFKILDVSYKLYGMKDGDYPVTNSVLGNFTAENLKNENAKGISEIIINTHGQIDNMDRCFFVGGKEVRESLINMQTANQVLSGNYYYLDAWACNNNINLANNLTTTLLNGKCVGMFSATHIISNNGVNVNASLSKMTQSNFYWFYYQYLKALNEGATRSEAFHLAQKSYGEVLMEDSKNGIRSGEGNYQFNLSNLLVYQNSGLIELRTYELPDKGVGTIVEKPSQTIVEEQSHSGLQCTISNELKSGKVIVHSLKYQIEGEHVVFTLDITAPKNINTSFFTPPNGELLMVLGTSSKTKERDIYTFRVKKTVVQKTNYLTMNFYRGPDDRCFVSFDVSNIL